MTADIYIPENEDLTASKLQSMKNSNFKRDQQIKFKFKRRKKILKTVLNL